MTAALPLAVLIVTLSLPWSAIAAKYEAGLGSFAAFGGAPSSGHNWSAACAGQVCPGTATSGRWLLESGILTALRRAAGINIVATLPESAPELADLPLTIEVRATVPVDRVNLRWRAGGGSSYASSLMASQDGSVYASTIPAAEVTLRGLEVYFEAISGDRTARWPAASPETNPRRIAIIVNEASGGGDLTTDAAVYRMLSLPATCTDGTVHNLLEDDLGLPDRASWRLGRWSPTSERYQEHGIDGVESFAPGCACWIITASARSLDFSGRTAFPSSGDVTTVTLAPGWNQIGSPFAFPVDLADLEVRSAGNDYTLAEASAAGLVEALPLHEYDGTGYTTAARLEPWIGYFVANLHTQAIELLIPMREASSAPVSNRPEGPVSSTAGTGSAGETMPPLEWSARLTALTGGRAATLEVGAAAEALAGWDPLDRLAPPPPPDAAIALHGNNEQITPSLAALSRDIRPSSDLGIDWQITLEPNGAADVELRWEPSGLAPGVEARLADPGANTWVDLSAGPARLAPPGAGPYHLLVGRRAWLDGQLAGNSRIAPMMLRLDGPSPFRGSTRVSFFLPSTVAPTLRVCDLSGRIVRQLLSGALGAGTYSITWDGRSDSDAPLPAGVYFVQLAAGNHRSSVRVVLVH